MDESEFIGEIYAKAESTHNGEGRGKGMKKEGDREIINY